jgi:tetratricopeptide (TPR) repeat protein
MSSGNKRNLVFTWNEKGNSFYKLGKYEEAIQCYDRAIEIEPNIAAVWHNKALCLQNLGRYEEDIECHHRVVDIDPNYGNYHKEWCKICGNIILIGIDSSVHVPGVNDDAYYHETCKMENLRWLTKAKSFHESGEYEKAIEYYNRALEVEPHDGITWYNIATCFKNLGQHKEAKECYVRAFKIRPDLMSE